MEIESDWTGRKCERMGTLAHGGYGTRSPKGGTIVAQDPSAALPRVKIVPTPSPKAGDRSGAPTDKRDG